MYTFEYETKIGKIIEVGVEYVVEVFSDGFDKSYEVFADNFYILRNGKEVLASKNKYDAFVGTFNAVHKKDIEQEISTQQCGW